MLDVDDDDVTISGNNSTFFRPPGAESFRFLHSIGYVDPDHPIAAPASAIGPKLRLNDLTLSGANVFDYTYANGIDRAFPVLDGGAVRLDNADLITNNVTFFHNTSADNGGAVALNARYGFNGRSSSTTPCSRTTSPGSSAAASPHFNRIARPRFTPSSRSPIPR